jgi:hypothetical protein
MIDTNVMCYDDAGLSSWHLCCGIVHDLFVCCCCCCCCCCCQSVAPKGHFTVNGMAKKCHKVSSQQDIKIASVGCAVKTLADTPRCLTCTLQCGAPVRIQHADCNRTVTPCLCCWCYLQGTFASDYNDQPFCTKCPKGMTTKDEGSGDSGACSYAQRGMYVSSTGEGVACPLDTYSDSERNDTSCIVCPFGLKTESTGSEGVAMCLAPPGWELR